MVFWKHVPGKNYCLKLHKHRPAIQSSPGFALAGPSSLLSLDRSSFIVSSGSCALTSLTSAVPFVLTMFGVFSMELSIPWDHHHHHHHQPSNPMTQWAGTATLFSQSQRVKGTVEPWAVAPTCKPTSLEVETESKFKISTSYKQME